MEKVKFECRICMEKSENPVATQCGHLFCKNCIDRWLTQNNAKLVCPVCKSGVSLETLIRINPDAAGNTHKANEKVSGGNSRVYGENTVNFHPDSRDISNADALASFMKFLIIGIIVIMTYRILFG